METNGRILAPPPVHHLGEHRERGGGHALRSALELDAGAIIGEITASGLRGRGGAGFPTGRKWATVAEERADADRVSVVVNAAEGEPGTFKDRMILRHDPYRVLEGAAIAARTVVADRLVVALKASFRQERARVITALREMREAGWLEGIETAIVDGPPEYLFGEETALLEVVEGRPPFPRLAPPYQQGVEGDGDHTGPGDERLQVDRAERAQPALVNNVETFANIGSILTKGADWFRQVGTAATPGTIVVTIAGATRRHVVMEVPAGTPLSDVIAAAGGADDGRRLVAALPGVAHPLLPADAFGTPLCHEAMAEAGSGLGAAGFTIFDDTFDMVAVAQGVARFLAVESCGQCDPCKRDGLHVAETLTQIQTNTGGDIDRLALDDRLDNIVVGARCALAEQHQSVVGSMLRLFEDDLDAHLKGDAEPAEPVLIAPILDLDPVTDRFVLDEQHAAKQPDWSFDERWDGTYPAPATQRS